MLAALVRRFAGRSFISQSVLRHLHQTLHTMGPRFEIYVKAASNGNSIGDCPFSHFVSMVAQLKIPQDQYVRIPVDFKNKSKEFLTLNPEGSVPVLLDTETKAVKTNSQSIIKYIDDNFPNPSINVDYSGPAIEACSGVFPKLAALLKNKDRDAIPKLRKALEDELNKVDSFLKAECTGKFLTGDAVSALDCSLLPKLRHVKVAGKYFQNFDIPEHFDALYKYITAGDACEAFQKTSYPDEEIIQGWSRHGLIKVN